MLIDTHCHIHESYELDAEEVLERSQELGIETVICVGTSEKSSSEAISFAQKHTNSFASIGVHPHDTEEGYGEIAALAEKYASSKELVAVGEIGLDYYYTHSSREVQIEAFESQLETALKYELPLIFHVRDAFDDFWPIFEKFEKKYGTIRGVLHSFTDSQANMEKAVQKGLYIGVNGISTFTKDPVQQAMFDAIPLTSLLFETDAPFLTPAPYRGKINEPAYVRVVAEYHAHRRGITLDEIAEISTRNARALFTLEA